MFNSIYSFNTQGVAYQCEHSFVLAVIMSKLVFVLVLYFIRLVSALQIMLTIKMIILPIYLLFSLKKSVSHNLILTSEIVE